MKKIILFSIFGLFIFLSNIQFVFAASYACECNGGGKSVVSVCTDCPKNCTDTLKGKGEKSCVISIPTDPSVTAPKILPDPLGITDPNLLIARIINFVLSLVGSVSLLLFVYGGITWMTSAGSAEKVKKGRDIIVWAVIGLAVVFMSYILVRFVIQGITGVGS